MPGRSRFQSRAVTSALCAALLSAGARAQPDVTQAPPAPPARAAARAPLADGPPRLVWYVSPTYPRSAFAAGIEAAIGCTLVLDAQGAVVRATCEPPAASEPGPPGQEPLPAPDGAQASGLELAAAAEKACGAFRFLPARARGRTASTNLSATVHFRLHSLDAPVDEPPEAPAWEEGPAVTVEGDVLVSGFRTPLVGADLIAQGTGRSATSDPQGRFTLQLPPGDHLLVVTAAGFAPAQVLVTAEAGRLVVPTVYLLRTRPGLYEATVKSDRAQKAASKSTVTHEELRNVPGAQNDPLRVIENLPGVARAPFGGGQLIVRGAKPYDTGAFYDGQRIPNLYHFKNGPSVLSEEMVERIDFFAGGAGVFFGRQLAGIVEVVPRSVEVERLHGAAAVDLNKTSAFLRGPMTSGTQFAAGGRVSYVNPVLRFLADPHQPYQVPVYWDYQANLEQRLPDGSRLSLTGFGSGDSYNQVSAGRGNTDASSNQRLEFHRLQLRWEKRLSDTVSLSLSPQAGLDDSVVQTQNTGAGAFGLPQKTGEQHRDLGLRSQLSARLWPALELRAGLDLLYQRVAYQIDRQFAGGLLSAQPGAGAVNATRARFDGISHLGNSGGYLEAALLLGGLQVTAGLRSDLFRWDGRTNAVADPRLWARYLLTEGTALFASAGLYHQAPLASELDPHFGNPGLSPEAAEQYGLGVERKQGSDWTFRVEGFVQRRDALPFAAPARLRADGSVDNPLLRSWGLAHSVGVEVLIRRELTATIYGWIAYTFSRSRQRQRPGFPWEPTDFDQPHVLTLLLGWRPSTQLELSLRARVASGNPVHQAVGAVFDSDSGNYLPETRPYGETRLPTFVQLDFQINNLYTFDSLRLGLYFELQNVANRKNAEAQVYDYRFQQPEELPGVPLLATVGARVSF